jgi:hypothetical protein
MHHRTFNLPQVNPVAAAAIDAGSDNKTHDRTAYPLHVSYLNKKPRCFKVILNAEDRIDNSTLVAPKYYVQLPDAFKSNRLNLVVESCFHSLEDESNKALDQNAWMLNIRELRNPYSWDSKTGIQHGTILVASNRTYVNNNGLELGGATVVDKTLFSRPITFEFTSPHFDINGVSALTNHYTIVLNIYDEGDN